MAIVLRKSRRATRSNGRQRTTATTTSRCWIWARSDGCVRSVSATSRRSAGTRRCALRPLQRRRVQLMHSCQLNAPSLDAISLQCTTRRDCMPPQRSQAPNYILVKGGWGPSNLTYSAELASGIPSTEGGHTVSISTTSWPARVRYVELSEVIVDRGGCNCHHAIITEMEVEAFATTTTSQCAATTTVTLLNESALQPIQLCSE